MEKSKAFQLFKSLSEQERFDFRQFLASPYFNRKPTLIDLYELFLEWVGSEQKQLPSREAIFERLFPETPYSEKALTYLSSDLNKSLEQFLVIQQLQTDSNQYQLLLLQELANRNLPKSFQQINRNLTKQFKQAEGKSDTATMEDQFRWWDIQEQYFQKQRLRKFDPSIQHAAEYLDRYYYLQRLNYSCAMLDRSTILQAPYEVQLSDHWLQHLREQDFFQEPIIQLYHSILLALQNEEEERYYDKLKQFLLDYPHKQQSSDLHDIYLFAINYCARKIRKGKDRFVEEALVLYQHGIERRILIKNDALSPWTFTNVVKLALRLKRFAWIKTFIPRYAPLLPEAFRANALHYNLAEVHYYSGQNDQAQEHLRQVVFSDLNYYLGARVMMAKIYYEEGEEEPLLSLIASFTIFLKRNKEISEALKKTFLNFCTLLFQIIRWTPRQVPGLKQKLAETDPLTDRQWLQNIYEEKLGEGK